MHARPSVVHLCVPDVRSSDTQPRPAVLPGIRIHISSSMSSIQRLSSVIIDKDNSTRGTIAGQCLVCIDARSASTPSSATNDNTEGDFAVFDTQQNADTYITAARDALASGSSSTPPGGSSDLRAEPTTPPRSRRCTVGCGRRGW